jgi:hypothetical protein
LLSDGFRLFAERHFDADAAISPLAARLSGFRQFRLIRCAQMRRFRRAFAALIDIFDIRPADDAFSFLSH